MAEGYVLEGPKWGNPTYGTSSGKIYWSFALYNWGGYNFDAVISNPVYQQLVRDAFAAWEAVANVDFVEITDSASSMLRLGWDYIDGPYNIVGQASWQSWSTDGVNYAITGAEIRFDTSETWSTNEAYIGNDTNFYTVAVHEIGHTLGLGHPNDPTQIMYAQSNDQLTLGSGDIAGIQKLYGPNPASIFIATPYNDRFDATPANDVIDGLGGIDTVLLAGSRNGFQVGKSGGTLTVTGQGTDIFTNIERLWFTDGTLAYDTAGNAGAAYRLYRAAFDRAPDASGLGYWVRELDRGAGDLAWMANNFIISEEFKAKYGTPSTMPNQSFLDLIYQNVLDRSPDTDGLNYWMGELNRGFERERVLASFSESAENQANVAAAIQDGIWYV